MKKRNYILFLASFLILFKSAFAQQPTPIDDLKRGARILAYQFWKAKDGHKAKTMAKFLTIIDKDNGSTQELINIIRKDQNFMLSAYIEDEGIAYADFLLSILKILPDNADSREKRNIGFYICTILNPKSPAAEFLPKNVDFSKFYNDIFEGSPTGPDKPKPPMVIQDPATVLKNTVIPSLNYNPTELLQAINLINYRLRDTGVFVNIVSDKVNIDFVDEDNGYKIFEGEKVKAQDKNVFFQNIQLSEFLKFIEHTTSLTYIIQDNAIELVDVKDNAKGRPEYFKMSQSLLKEIQTSVIKSRSTYDNKTMQIKGTITNIKDSGSQLFYIELDNYFVIVVNKSLLKPDSIKMITEKFTEYAQAKKDGVLKTVSKNRPYLEVVARGKCLIKSINQIFINDCNSILAEDAGLFYTK